MGMHRQRQGGRRIGLLTEAGRELEPIVFGLGTWGARWAFGDPRPDELDSELLVWWMHTRIDADPLPDRKVILHLRFSDEPKLFWLVVESGQASVCLTDPGFEVDVTIRSDMVTMYKVWLGRVPIRSAIASGHIELDGTRALVRRMPQVLELSPIAQTVANTPVGR